MSSNHKLVLSLVAFVVFIVGVVGIFWPLLAVGLALLICMLLVLLRGALMPAGYGTNKVRMLSLILASGLTASYGAWSAMIDSAVKIVSRQEDVRRALPWLTEIDFGREPSIVVLAFFLLVVWIVNHYMADRSIAGSHPSPLVNDFPDVTFSRKLEIFCSALQQHLETTDREANWSPEYYADLEAEVEVLANAGSMERRRIVDLQEALRAHRDTRSFLILGDPGAGKSVALRKLARDMLKEVGDTGRVPIYVNLREWLPRAGRREGAWTPDNRPSVQDLEGFVFDNVKARGDVFTEEFVDDYFRKLWQHGRLFFLFDSFDEIPELLDVNEEAWLLDALSDLLHRFIATNPASRGVLASRMFRRPTQAFPAQKTLEIRPLSEHRIEVALKRFRAFTPELRARLFRERTDLVPVARNPFLMTLLGEWVNEHRNLPPAQAQLYESYMRSRLSKCASRISQAGLTEQQVFEGATEIAAFVFNSPEYGLEAPVQVIGANVCVPGAPVIMDILSFARLARVAQGGNRSFAFVHRRFLEYLVTTVFLAHRDRLPDSHIPTDSRGRDAMVLYAQICEPAEAERLARFCWAEVLEYFDNPQQRLRAIHCLRFLIDAFRSHDAAIQTFVNELAAVIERNIKDGGNLVTAKICLEGVALLPEDRAMQILHSAMQSTNSWLQETAFRACRHMPSLRPDLQASIEQYVMCLPIPEFWFGYEALRFSLSLSDALKDILAAARWRHANLLVSAATAPIALLGAPFLTGLVIMIALLAVLISSLLENNKRGFFVLGEVRTLVVRLSAVVCVILLIRDVGEVNLRQFVVSLFEFVGPNDLLGAKRLGEADSVIFNPLEWPLRSISEFSTGWVYGLIAIGLMDWPRLSGVRGTLVRVVESPVQVVRQLFRKMLVPVAAFMLVIPFLYGINWLEHLARFYIADWVRHIAFVLFLMMVLALSLGVAYWRLHIFLTDRAYILTIPIVPRMPRSDIVQVLGTIVTLYWRLEFVRRLADEKVVAVGEWPTDFRLAIGGDDAVTALARLEERWLKLDR